MVDVEESLGEDSGLVSVQGRQGNVSFRPYRDIKTKVVQQQQQQEGEEEGEGDTTVDNLYPELLCHIFSHLDTASNALHLRSNHPQKQDRISCYARL